MAYCARCGVEVDERKTHCPLCQAPIVRFDESNNIMNSLQPYPDTVPPKKKRAPGDTRYGRKIALSILTVTFLIPVVVLVAIDLRYTQTVSWSLYPNVILGACYLISILPLLFTGPRFLKFGLGPVIYLIIAAALFVMDQADPFKPWALTVAIPIETAGALLALGVVLISQKTKKLGSNLGGYIIIAITLQICFVELVLNWHLLRVWKLDWSFLSALALLPVALLLFYIHYVLGRKINLKKIFHI